MANLHGATAQSNTGPRNPATGGNTQAGVQQQAAVKPFCQASKVGTRLVGNFAPVVGAAPAPIGPTASTLQAVTSSDGF